MFKYRCFSSLWSRWWCAWQLFRPFHSCMNLPALLWLFLLELQTHRRRTQNCDEGPDVAFVCARRSNREHQHVFLYVRVGEGQQKQNVIFGERPLALASRWPLTQIKLPQFSPSPLLPQPPSFAHCQALLFSHGRLLREHAHICGFRGWQ